MELRPFTIRDAISGVLSRKVLVVFIFTMILLLVGVATLMTEKMYQSEAKIFVRLGKENVGLDPTLALGEKPVITAPMSREAEINSVAFMIKSRNLFENVVDDIGHERILEGEVGEDKGPGLVGSMIGPIKKSLAEMGVLNDISRRELAIIKIGKKLSVKTMDRSNVVVVNYEGESPKLAQDVVASLVQHYRSWHVKMHMLSGTQEVLLTKTREIEEELESREAELEEFKTSTGMVTANLDGEQFVRRVGVIKDELLTAEADAAALAKEVKEMQNNLESVSARRNEQAIKSTQGTNPVHDEILIALLTKQPLLEAARSKSKFLKNELELVQKQLSEFSTNDRRYRKLVRELGITDEKYRRYMKSLAQGEVDSSLLENPQLSNISISQPASFSEKPVRPNKLINLVLGLGMGTFCSLGLAVFLEYMSTTVRTREDLESSLGLPVIATVPRVARRKTLVPVEV